MSSNIESEFTEHTKAVFITGATGLAGAQLTKELLKQDVKIKALFRSEIPFQHKKIEWVQGDLLDTILMEEILQNIDEVYHCAAYVSFNPKHKKELFKTNIEGTANIVNACLNTGVKKLLHVSSVAALGKAQEHIMLNENTQWNEDARNSIYGESKYLGELEVWRGIAEGLNAVIINPSTILGAGNWNKSSSEIFKTVYNEFPYFSEGATGFVYVEDVVAAMLALMKSNISAQRFIISAENISYKELFFMIADAFHKKRPYKKVTPAIAAFVWRMEAFKSAVTGKDAFITKETARAALAKMFFDNSKLLYEFPQFKYTPLKIAVEQICNKLTV